MLSRFMPPDTLTNQSVILVASCYVLVNDLEHHFAFYRVSVFVAKTLVGDNFSLAPDIHLQVQNGKFHPLYSLSHVNDFIQDLTQRLSAGFGFLTITTNSLENNYISKSNNRPIPAPCSQMEPRLSSLNFCYKI